MFALDLDKHKSLIKLRSGNHLDMESKQYLYHVLAAYPSHHKTICEMSILFKFSYYRIVDNEDEELNKSEHSSNYRGTTNISEEAKELIKLAVKPLKKPLVLSDLIKMIHNTLDESISYSKIRLFTKNELKYSYK